MPPQQSSPQPALPERVFTCAGGPVKNVNTRGWWSAPKRVSIDNFRWHDLRHIRANWRVQNGTPLYLPQEMGGGKSAEMVRRYAHPAPAQMAQQAKVVGDILRDTHSSQGRKITEPIDVKKGLQQS